MDSDFLSSLLEQLVNILLAALAIILGVGGILIGIGMILYLIGAGDYYISFIQDLFSFIWNYLSIILTTIYLFYSLPKWNVKIEEEKKTTPGCSFAVIKMLIIAALLFWGTLSLQEYFFDIEKFNP